MNENGTTKVLYRSRTSDFNEVQPKRLAFYHDMNLYSMLKLPCCFGALATGT